jgi:diadenylate cyclase
VIDILVVALLFYWFYTLIRGTRAVQIIYGIIILVLIWVVARLLQLNTLIFILQNTLTALIIAIPVVFQPELRNALVKLGRTKITNTFWDLKKNELDKVIETISEASEELSKQKVGALIVLVRGDRLHELTEKAKVINADISTELILNIFAPKTPLHDGAIIITGNKIKAAGAVLPLSDSKFNYHLGTRHRAAIGLSTSSDALVIVVSEETGIISLAEDGLLESRLDKVRLKNLLEKALQGKKTDKEKK